MRLTIATKHGQNKAEQVSAERLVNMYSEAVDGKSNVVVHGAQGEDLFTTCGNGPIRGLHVHNKLLYAVSGTTLYEVDNGGVATSKGTIAGDGIVGMATNGTNLCIVNGAQGYLYGSSLGQITDTDFGLARTVGSLNGYFIFSDGTNSFFINTTPFDGSNYDALDFASAEANPDIINRIFVNHKELMLFGTETMEPWVGDSGSFAFAAVVGAISEKGLASPWAIANIDNTVFWLDQNGIARRMSDGYNPQIISTTSEVEAWAGNAYSSAEAIAFIEDGHEFFALTFDNGTWVYDAATNLWHERATWEKPRWRARCHSYIYEKNIVGDYETGALYSLNGDTFTTNSTKMVSEMYAPPINMDGRKFKVAEIQLDLEQGEGGGEVRLWISNDGLTWRNAGFRSLGADGSREARTIWRNLGQHRNLHRRYAFSGNFRRAVFSEFARLT